VPEVTVDDSRATCVTEPKAEKPKHNEKPKRKLSVRQYAAIRLSELRKLQRHRAQHGIELQLDNWLFVICHTLAPLKEQDGGLDLFHLRDLWRPCPLPFDDDDAVEMIHKVCDYRAQHPNFRNLSSDTLGKLLNVTAEERRACGFTTVESAEEPQAARRKRQKTAKLQRDRVYQSRRRRSAGRKPHAESASQTEPWIAAGFGSRRTWERHGKPPAKARDAKMSPYISLPKRLGDTFATIPSLPEGRASLAEPAERQKDDGREKIVATRDTLSTEPWDRRFSSRGSCRRASGRTSRARIVFRPMWFCRASAASLRCSIALAAARPPPMTAATKLARLGRHARSRRPAPEGAARARIWMTRFRSKMTQQKNTAMITLDDLASAFPMCFFVNHKRRRPIKIDIDKDLLPLVSCSEEELKAALSKYTRSDGYLVASTEGAIRIDVHGNAAGTVTAAQATRAKMKLDQPERWRAKQKRKQQQAAASQREAPTASNAPAHVQQQPTKRRGDGLEALKAAAARRRNAAA
jgi:ProP effector